MVKKVAIIGAGSCGLLLAHYLLRRDEKYQVDIYERRNDPRIVEFSKARTFPITLNERGIKALSKIEGLIDGLRDISVEMMGTIFHQKNGKKRVRSRKKPLTALDRTNLVILLLEKLTQKYGDRRLNIHFNCECTQVNFTAKTVKLTKLVTQEDFTNNYDLLIGADGSRSAVRKHFLDTELFEFQQKHVPTDYKSIYLPKPETGIKLEPDSIHSWRNDDGTTILLLQQADETIGGAILFFAKQTQLASASTTEELIKYFQENFPDVAKLISISAAEDFLQKPISKILTIRCNRYHQGDSVLLMGDAAHAVSASIGQGCNAALEDVLVFDNILDEYSDNIATAIEQFTIRRHQDAIALVELGDYAFPLSKGLFIEFILREQMAKTLHRISPQRFPASLSELVFETAAPYSEILNLYQGWISKVKKSNEKFLANL
ncbi:MAG: NAD(P)/FAD-dependent oxidoreductase [Nostocales cyanobacterium 94392]|nr:NAD(P)/FAD-dependent oxidoreductase [Nostocales cyanobacterium 94392]